MRDSMKSPFLERLINDSMFIEDWSRWRQYDVPLEINDIFFHTVRAAWLNIIVCKDQRENYKSLIKEY